MTKRECIFICVVILRFFSACNAKELMMKEMESVAQSLLVGTGRKLRPVPFFLQLLTSNKK